MKLKFLIITLFTFAMSFAQNKGTVTGTIADKDLNNEPLPFATILIKGTQIGTNTDENGKYTLSVPAGSHTLIIDFLGYEPKEIPFTVKAGETKTINEALGSTSVELEGLVMEKTVSREKESALLAEQKKAVEIKQNIGAQELERKGVSDVATAVTKTTGISKQEGSGSVYVRGLGDRYNMTTMNGLPLPSNNPSRKNISLEIFSTDIVEFIGIDKTYYFKNYGDFAGANIDISSKNYKGNGFFEVGVGTGVSQNAINADNFYQQDGPAFTGFSNQKYPSNPLEAYNFTTSWDKQTATPVNMSVSLKGGDSYDIGEEGRLSFFATGSFDSEYSYREGIARGNVSNQGIARKDFNYDSYTHLTNTTLMGNANYKINLDNTIKFNSLFVNSTSQSLDEYNGTIDIFDNAPNGGGYVRRSTFDRTSLYVNQLLGNHKLNERVELDWGTSYNIINNVIPDRMQNTFVPVDNDDFSQGLKVSDLAASDNHRYYQDLTENEFAANFNASYKFNKDDEDNYKGKFTVGYSGRFKSVDFEATQFNFKIDRNINFNDPILIDLNNIDGYFNQNNIDNGRFDIVTFRGGVGIPTALDPQTYNGKQSINAGFGAVEYKFSPRLTVIGALRLELIKQDLEYKTALRPQGGDSNFESTEFMPSTAIKYELTDKQNLKFAASKTYTLPQFKERAPFQYEEVTQITFGNPDLYASTDYNVDLKWEFFPKATEIISFTAFGKYIQNPMNEVTVASATNDISYLNTGEKAVAIGGEFEIRKDLFDFSGEDATLNHIVSAGFNASYMYNNQDFSSQKVSEETNLNVNFTNDEGKLTGASDLLLNADVSYLNEFSEDRNLMATLTYNYFSDRLYAIGTNTKGNIVDKAVGTLDFIVKSNINKKLNIGFSVRNILNPTVERIQEDQNVLVAQYKKGMVFKLGLTYKL
ncbi:TonB-dependent receptor [Flavobacterium beibuense F44-8]|uniref:TonB-dependent receptor n=1 Tax=Flavobacterium beibuense F44-8 TaxID=1406840 RepID=A0A0A2LUR3_9FLAO|nr:TonB-dependent receptor [Flavobacterium beibuense]KGO79900.1 TonB-dependent receptor [Flavobacterium beibuense F44-8]